MKSDCAFVIGKGHKICQDYAIAGSEKGMHYVIVADGCSSSPDTDIGARFLAKAAETFLYQIRVTADARSSLKEYHEQSVRFAALCTRVLKLDPSCLDATLMTIKAEGNAFVASCYGDGVIALGRRDGRLEVYSVEFKDGFPQYVSYMLHALRQQEFHEQTNNQKDVTQYMISQVSSEPTITRSHEVIEFHFGYRSEYVFAAVMSDGVHSFQKPDATETATRHDTVPLTEILSLLLDFKGGSGDFVCRRLKTFKNICLSRNWHHDDDLSVGVVYLEDER